MTKKKSAKLLSPNDKLRVAGLVEIVDHIDRAYQLSQAIGFDTLTVILASVGHSLVVGTSDALMSLKDAIKPWAEEQARLEGGDGHVCVEGHVHAGNEEVIH